MGFARQRAAPVGIHERERHDAGADEASCRPHRQGRSMAGTLYSLCESPVNKHEIAPRCKGSLVGVPAQRSTDETGKEYGRRLVDDDPSCRRESCHRGPILSLFPPPPWYRGRMHQRCLCSTLFLLLLLQHADGWISLSDKGYTMKHSLAAQAGVKVQGAVNVNGLLISKPVADLQCNPSRRGAIRWNEDLFEGCDGKTDWRPLTFCSRSCNVNTDTVPCKVQVRNRCDKFCNQYGTGLNMRQCILNVAATPCHEPVRDLCGNICGLEGQSMCSSKATDMGKVVVKALQNGTDHRAHTSFEFGVRGTTQGTNDDGLYWTYKNDIHAQQGEDMVVFQKLEATSVPAILQPPRGPNDTMPVQGKPFGTTRGMEISKPPSNDEATLRVSMYTELTGGYIRIGEDYNVEDQAKKSFVFIDSVIEKECPFLMNAGNYQGNKFTKVCLEPAKEEAREIVLPDASGVVITTGSEADVRSLPGLRKFPGESIFTFSSNVRDTSHITPPEAPRVDCSQFSCSEPGLQGFASEVQGSGISHCKDLNYEDPRYDMYRLFYGFFDYDRSRKIFRIRSSVDVSKYGWSADVQDLISSRLQDPQEAFADIARTFVSLQMMETGVDMGDLDVVELLESHLRFGPIPNEERCFVCCCHSYVASQADNSVNISNAEKGVCPYDRTRPNFCLSGPKVGQQCEQADECIGKKFGLFESGPCGYDESVVTCMESDQGWLCWNVIDRNPIATRIDFVEPTRYRRLGVPAVSGTFLSTGNLDDITSLGIQAKPMVVMSSHDTFTTIQFEREHASLKQINTNMMNNTLVVPNNLHQSMLLSTGNLEDITLDSGAMRGLSVETDVYVRRFLKFGDDNFNSGFLLEPLTPSSEYSKPHGGTPASYARPGQISFQVHDSQTVLEFEPARNGSKVSEITIPQCSGTMLTTGNLEAITAQSGFMTSLAVDDFSYLQGGVAVGSRFATQLTVQGHAAHAITFETNHWSASNREEYSNTRVAFELGNRTVANLVFPAVDGTVITTGNLPDIHEYRGYKTRVQREAHFRGPTFVGPEPTADESNLYRDPIIFSGYLTGPIIHREAPDEEMLYRPKDSFEAPYTWDVTRYASCNLANLKAASITAGKKIDTPIFANPRFEVDPWSVQVVLESISECRRKCALQPGCGLLFASRYWKVKLLSVVDYRPTSPEDSLENYVSNAIKRPNAKNGYLDKDYCYPGFNPSGVTAPQAEWEDMIPQSADFDYVMNLTKYPAIRNFWTTDSSCQGVIAARGSEWASQFDNAWKGFSELDLQPAKCGQQVCSDPDNCTVHSETCLVTIKSRVNDFYLTGFKSALCYDQLLNTGPCAQWTTMPTVWASIPYKLDPSHPRYDDWKLLNTATLYRYRRFGHCFDVNAASLTENEQTSLTITCGGDQVQNVSVYWGDVDGSCGGYEHTSSPCADMNFIRNDFLLTSCLGGGCTIRIQRLSAGVRLSVTSISGAEGTKTSTFSSCTGKRFAAQFECKDQWYLGRAKAGVKPHFQMWEDGNDDNTLFHMHSTQELQNPSVESPAEFLPRECWLVTSPAYECQITSSPALDLHMFLRHDSLSLAFSTPSQKRTVMFPDADGVVISAGNLKDVKQLRGLYWKDTLIYKHLPPPELRDGDSSQVKDVKVSHVDFAIIGSGSQLRLDGKIPPEFSIPDGANRRIVFPDSSGTVITTGNVDDLLFKQLNLEGLSLDGELIFKNSMGPKVFVHFADSTRVAGCLNMVREKGTHAQDHYTQFCTPQVSQLNEITLPDASGTIITTGNMLNLPTVQLEASELSIGGDVTMEGDMKMGQYDSVTNTKAYAWIDGDVGMTFASANSSSSIQGDVLNLHSPHMGGVDIALRHYLTDGIQKLEVQVQEAQLYGPDQETTQEVPLNGTSQIDQSMCFDLLSKHHVHGFHGLGYFAHRRQLIKQTIVSGTPYWGVDVPGNLTFPACVHVSSGKIMCEGAKWRANECSENQTCTKLRLCRCQGLGEEMMVLWRRVTMQIIHGFRRRCPNKEFFWYNESGRNESRYSESGGNESSVFLSQPVWDCQYDQAICEHGLKNDAGCAFDGNVSTQFVSTNLSLYVQTPLVEVQPEVRNFSGYGSNPFQPVIMNGSEYIAQDFKEIGRCVLGLRFNTSVGVTMVRVFPASQGNKMIGGLLQGSRDPEGQIWVDLFQFMYDPPPGIWTDVMLTEWTDSDFVFLRYLGPACDAAEACSCDTAEWEWHQGFVSQRLSATERGVRSYFVNEKALRQDSDGAMVFKCASRGWYPSKLQTDVHEILLPEASGMVLTTGNLQDVTKIAGTMTSVKVSGDVDVGGSTILGARGEETRGQWNAHLTGRFPLSLAGGGNYDAASFFTMDENSMDNLIFWPAGSIGGSVVTTGMLPPLSDHISIVGEAAVRGKVHVQDDIVIGDHIRSSTLRLHSPIARAFPLTFKEASTLDEHKLVFGLEEPLGDGVLMLPDATGTVITTGNLPDVMENLTLIADTVFEAPVKFIQEDVVFGQPESKINLAIHAPIAGSVPLKFEGRQIDERTLSLSVEEPSSQNILSLPDVTGTVITTGNLPDTVDKLRVLGNLGCLGNVSMIGREISIGHDELKTKLSIESTVAGRFPLAFGHVSTGNPNKDAMAATTTFEIVPPTGDNVITFPDTSGSVITTGNIPTTVMVADEYSLHVKALLAVSSSIVLGHGAKSRWRDSGSKAEGSFSFNDASQPQVHSYQHKPNSFDVCATGGVKFITGYTASQREVGVLLEARSSGWSVLSDTDSKIKLDTLDDIQVLEKMVRIPVSTWRYQGQHVTHMGPMAQDMYAAFGTGEEHLIRTSDADGAIISALRGVKKRVDQVQDRLYTVHENLLMSEASIERQADKMSFNQGRLATLLQQVQALQQAAHEI